MANSTGSSSTASRNPYLLVGIGIVIGLLLSIIYSQVFHDNTKVQTGVQVTTVPSVEAVQLTNEDKIIGKWELISDSKFLDQGIGSEFEFIKGGNLNTNIGAFQFSFPDAQHLKLANSLESKIVSFSIDDKNITLQETGQSAIILAPLVLLDVTPNDLTGVWAIIRRMGSDEPCINVKIQGEKFNDMTFNMLGPRSIAFDADGKMSIWTHQFLIVDKDSYNKEALQGTYQLDKGTLIINSTTVDSVYDPLNASCRIQKTNTKLILGSNTNGSILHLIRANTP